MDKYYFLNAFLFRILLPILISTCIIFRPSGLSAIYLLVMFYLPFVPVPQEITMSGHSGVFLKILIAISILTALCQATFQIVLLTLPPYAQFLQDDPFIEKILRHVGLVRLNEISPEIVVRWLSPEILMVAIAISYYISMRKLTTLPPDDDIDELSRDTRVTLKTSYAPKNTGPSVLVAIGRYLVLLSLCSAAVLRPSVVGGFYFLVFLSAATYWASYRQLRKGFALFMYCILPIVFLHISCFYAYQFQWPQELLEKNNTYARLFGLTPLILSPSVNKNSESAIELFNTTLDGYRTVKTNSTSKLNATSIDAFNDDPRSFVFADVEWASFVNPIILYILYYIVVLECKELLKPELQKKQGTFSRLESNFSGQLGRQMSQRVSRRRLMRSATTRNRWKNATRKVRALLVKPDIEPGETTPLIHGVSPSKKGSGRKSGIFQDSTGSVTATGENTEEIPMDELGTIEDEYEPTVLENILFALESVAQLIVRSSYIGTNIIMMAWSITYLSWLTFVLLIWANLIWLVPNQRKSMLRSSPFLVFYAWFLLISAYVYSMDLTEAELPSSIKGFNLSEIGLVKILILPCVPLFVKCAYTVMFWVTLRQYMQERKEQKQSNALADMVAPLQVTVGTAAGVNREQDKKGSKIMERIGQHLKKFLTKFWIWVVAVTLFAVAITGQRMTGFRILYMALFLIFVLSFQFSFQLWRRIMFGFWLTVIIYSMVILVLVYTYQFENFPSYWTEYLHIPQEQQLDIGLEQFKTKQLFVRLVTPTVFVIITVIQLHYFHNDFMTLSDPKNTNITSNNEVAEDLEQSSMQGGAYIDRSMKEDASSPLQFDLYDLEHYTSAEFQQLLRHWLERLHRIKNLIYLFLELHMIKLVLLFAMLLCVYDMCALYLIIIILISLALTFGRPMQLFAIYLSSFLVSILLLARMIYQIQYITPANWNVNCTITENPDLNQTTKNNAPWLGFQKMDEADRSLSSLVKWNVIYIVIVTLWAVVLVRQHKYRVMRGRLTTRAFFMFPNITRAEADKNLENCLKYLTNYGFYKFGVEICLMFTVAVIGTRMDLYSVLYSVWLCILFSMKRSFLARVWVFYLIFLAIALPFQYLMAVGLPPTLCQEFPWDRKDQMWRSLQDWAFLLDNYHPPPVKKLVLDFILLLLVSRQWVVFRIERRYSGNYAGGSNDSIIHHAEEKDFVNPVPDFITYVRSYLDIFKRGILQSFLWITLALVFLAGTNRVNIFSLGYLLGAFVFLWHGSDLYLRPISTVLKQWQFLLGYNVAVIFIKTAFQILGCIFIHNIPTNCCWLVQLLGIGCVRKFDVSLVNSRIAESTDSTYCTVPREFIGIAWDGLCFALLIMQRRIFNSYNFFHIVDETKATTILASRGAELIEEMREKTMNYQEEVEHRVLEKIKLKMDRIKRNQQKIQATERQPPLARSSSVSTCASATSQQSTPAGYHTPIDEEEPAPTTPRSSLMPSQAPPSPYSAVMTVSLEGYLEPQRMSFSSPPNSELNPRPSSTDDSFPVFSPPPYNDAPPYATEAPPYEEEQTMATVVERRKSSIGPPWMQGSLVTPRQSVISYSSRSPLSHHEYSVEKGRRKYRVKPPVTNKQAIRSGDYYMFDELDDEDIDLLPEEQDEDDNGSEMKSRKPDMSELLITAIKSDVSTAIQRQSQLGLRRQYSMPLSRQKSARSQMSAAFSAPPTIDENEPRSVRIREEPEDDEMQPGTSKDDDISELSEPKETFCKKILRLLLFIWAFVESVMISLTNFLNKYSRDYRYVLKVLAKEKKILKEKTAYNVGSRIGPGHVWQPAGSYHSLLRQSMKSFSSHAHVLQEIEEMSSYDQPTIVRLLLAIWYIIMSQSEILCYFVIFLNQMKTATFLSLPLPLMVFFWGSLTIPRPSKTFWVTIIAYTEVIVLLKCMFQFDIMPGNTRPIYESNTFSATKLIGLYRQENYATWDLLLLLVVFFHRVLLKSLGIWTTAPPFTTAVLTTGDYRLEDGQLIPVSSSSPKPPQRKFNVDPSGIISRRSSGSSRQSGQEEIVEVKVKKNVQLHKFSHALQISLIKYGEAIRGFINQLLDPTSRVAADVYSLMFLCDFLNFFVILFGYSAFGTQPDGGVSSYLEDNRVPPLFLFMLILQFMLLVIDRAIYLRKNILAKIIFQFIQIIVLHIWLFVVFPIITGSTCNTVLPPQIYYMAKCSYLLLSAFQIRCGYPTRILGNFLCKGYGLLNMCLFRGFMLVPFLFELRTCMDWMWTETSMTIFDWIKMEDIFAHVFLLKCSRQCEDEFPQPRGQKKKHFIKYLMGGGGLITIIAIIWFPLVFFSLGNAVGGPNIPFDVTLEIRIGPYEPIYKMSAQSNSIFPFSSPQLDDLKVLYDEYKTSETFIYNYEASDVAAVKLSTDSGSIWGISPPDRKRMVAEVNSTQPLQVRLTYIVSHKTSKKEDSGIIQKNIPIIIPAQTEERGNLLRMLEGESTEPILFQYILPKFLKVTNRGTAEPISDLMMNIPTEDASLYRNITINLNKTVDQEWWRIREECDDWNYRKFLKDIPFQDCANSIILYTFNDKIFPDTLEIISGAGIIGLYTTLVFVASRLARGIVADQCSKIMFDDMPNVDRVLQLCLDVFLVREACEFALEEDLFAKLVFLFRSPETLIKWTRPKEELAEDEDPEAEDQ